MEFDQGGIWLTPPEAKYIEDLTSHTDSEDIWVAVRSATIGWVNAVAPEDLHSSSLPYIQQYAGRHAIAMSTWRPEQVAPIRIELYPRQLQALRALAKLTVELNTEKLQDVDKHLAEEKALTLEISQDADDDEKRDIEDYYNTDAKQHYITYLSAEIEVYSHIVATIDAHLKDKNA